MKEIPYTIKPLKDESPSSWLLRIADKYHIDVITFLDYYNCSDLLKCALDVDADLKPLEKFVSNGARLPKNIRQILPDFTWINGRSIWLIENNKKGSSYLNSATRICPNCLKSKGYYQLKWKFNLFNGCADCGTLMVDHCVRCRKRISLHDHFKLRKEKPTSKNYLNCFNCNLPLTNMKTLKMNTDELDLHIKIKRAYSEDPPNIAYLRYLQLGEDPRFI